MVVTSVEIGTRDKRVTYERDGDGVCGLLWCGDNKSHLQSRFNLCFLHQIVASNQISHPLLLYHDKSIMEKGLVTEVVSE